MSDIETEITDEEFFEVSSYLKDKNAIFSKFWEIGKPVFTEETPTAAVKMDKEGGAISFVFNPIFWKYSDDYSRRFYICHEMLHLILNHGVRIKDAEKHNRPMVNVCADIVINHLLVRKFGFNRKKIKGFTKEMVEAMNKKSIKVNPNEICGGYKDFCWVDTVFDPKKHPERTINTNGKIPSDFLSFENYYNMLPKMPEVQGGDGSRGNGDKNSSGGQGGGFPSTVDDHDGLMDVEEIEEILKKIDKELTSEDMEEIEDMIREHFQERTQNKENKDGNDPGGQMAGAGAGSIFTFNKIDRKKIKPKPKWETIIKEWTMKQITRTTREKEQWARLNRRITMLPRDFFIPSEQEIEDNFFEKDKIEVFFVCDLSGSCIHLIDRFFKAALSLPVKKFKVRLFTFDTKCVETSLEKVGGAAAGKSAIYGGGGTNFSCIEKRIQSIISKEKIPYPMAVFVITDGYASDYVKPEMPSRWKWFLTENYTACIPKGSEIYSLKDFE